MKVNTLLSILALALTACQAPPTPAQVLLTRADWGEAFTEEGADGTFVLYHPRTGLTEQYHPERAAIRYCPASTFKVYNALVALETGAVRDVDSLHAWDGQERVLPIWNRDHSLRSGIRYSTVWLFQRLARDIDREAYATAFAKTPYGNAAVGADISTFWLDGSLRISADEQVRFLDHLRRGETGFAKAHEDSVYAMVPLLGSGVVDGEPYRLLGKTGWGMPDGEPEIGWLVGYLERGGDTLVYAMNSEEVSDYDIVGGRERIVRSILGLR